MSSKSAQSEDIFHHVRVSSRKEGCETILLAALHRPSDSHPIASAFRRNLSRMRHCSAIGLRAGSYAPRVLIFLPGEFGHCRHASAAVGYPIKHAFPLVVGPAERPPALRISRKPNPNMHVLISPIPRDNKTHLSHRNDCVTLYGHKICVL